MHFEFLVEDASGKILLESVVETILGANGAEHTYRIFSYKGIGRIPKGMTGRIDVRARILLDRLPALLRGYGKSLQSMGKEAAVVVVVDLDTRDCKALKGELLDVLAACKPPPQALFRIAIEEMEAWLLGDRDAILTAYPKAKERVLDRYQQDSICGTWELLADAVHKGGARALKKQGWPAPGRAKCEWAKRIGPLLDVEGNQSKSFQVFRDGVRNLAGSTLQLRME